MVYTFSQREFNEARNSPTFQQVVRGDNFLGLGMRPALTPRHTLAAEQAYNA
jgi:hypothetical protein